MESDSRTIRVGLHVTASDQPASERYFSANVVVVCIKKKMSILDNKLVDAPLHQNTNNTNKWHTSKVGTPNNLAHQQSWHTKQLGTPTKFALRRLQSLLATNLETKLLHLSIS